MTQVSLEKGGAVAVEKLHLQDFLNEYNERIWGKLKELEKNAEDLEAGMSELKADVTFVAESLPLISGIINVGSSRQHFNEACNWVREVFPNHDPVSILSALVFVYVVNDKLEASHDEDRKMWERINNRVHRIQQVKDVPASAAL